MKTLRRWLAPALGALLVVVGAVLVLTTPPVTFGWFAYAPLSATTFPPGLFPPAQTVWGIALIALGAATLIAVISYRLGRRAAPRRDL